MGEILTNPKKCNIFKRAIGCILYEVANLEKAYGKETDDFEKIKSLILNGSIPKMTKSVFMQSLFKTM